MNAASLEKIKNTAETELKFHQFFSITDIYWLFIVEAILHIAIKGRNMGIISF
jgi:hypothetical protein